MLTCKETEELLDIYLDGELDALVRESCTEHLRRCASCSKLLELKKVEAEIIRSSFPVPDIRPDFCKRVMENIISGREHKSFFSPLVNLLKKPWLAPALAGFILLFIVYGVSPSGFFAPDSRVISGKKDAAGDRGTGGIMIDDKTLADDNPDAGATAGTAPPEVDSAPPSSSPEAEKKPVVTEVAQERLLAAAIKEHENSGTYRKMETKQRERFNNPGSIIPAFLPVYLPVGFVLERIGSPDPVPADAGKQDDTVRETVLVIFSNQQTGERICLEIAPGNPFAETENLPCPAGQDTEEKETGEKCEQMAEQGKSEKTITWYAEKEGRHYTLNIFGNAPLEELKKVADSLQ